MRRSLSLIAVLGAVLLGACTDSGSREPAGPTAPGIRPTLQNPLTTEIQLMISQLLADQPGLRNAASAQFDNVVRSVDHANGDVAQNQAGALVNFLLKQSSAGKLSAPTQNVFSDVPGIPTRDQGLSQLIAAIYQYLQLHVPAGTELAKVDAAAEVVPVAATGTIIVTTGTGLAAVRIPPGALGNDALVTITPIPYQSFAPGFGPLFTPKDGSMTQVPYFYDVTAYPTDPTKPLADPFLAQVTVEVCQVESGPFAIDESRHPRLHLAHNVGTQLQILQRQFAPDLVCVPPSVGSVDAPMESEGWLARGVWEARTMPSRLAEVLTPASAFAGHGGLAGLTSSFSPFGAVDPGASAIFLTPFNVPLYGGGVNFTAVDATGQPLALQCGPAATNASSNTNVGNFDGATFYPFGAGQTTITEECTDANDNIIVVQQLVTVFGTTTIL